MKSKAILALFLCFCMFFFAGCKREPENQPPPQQPEPQQEVPETPPEPEETTVTIEKVAPVCVVINNHPAAKPQSGLQEATFVYEFFVEGGLTRFLAVYDRHFTDNFLIGPVRSIRPYFAEKAMEHGGAIVYSGSSKRTEQMIAGLKLKKIVSSEYLWRDGSRKAPHNLYTDLESIYKARGESEVERLVFEPPELPAGEEAKEIEITYTRQHVVTYAYDEESKLYLRNENGTPHLDRETGKQYGATRVIVQRYPHTDVPDPANNRTLVDIKLTGSGEAVLYEAGQKYHLTWEHTGSGTVYRHADGREVDLRLGNTWIQVVR
ncbi:MAG: DUF3048 domain-containing protein [Firmicutes bacterium]|nr:DUF3048 domain-containing protein [Bacillota bacterium]